MANVLSLFDGMSCGRLALKEANIKVTTYYASEIDKHACKVTKANWPNTIQLGDVTKWRDWNIDWSKIDLLLAGSPCQGFSYAGKQLAFNDPRSALFFVFIDILEHIKKVNPRVKFMLENVKMKSQYLNVISKYVGVKPVFINSADYSYCRRPRYYWTNFTIKLPSVKPRYVGDVLDFTKHTNPMSTNWHIWWIKNRTFQLKKGYSSILTPHSQDITMAARQYASWNGNFLPCGTGYRKPTKEELALLVGAPKYYFDCTSQRQAECMTGNGWTIHVVSLILKCLL